MKHLVTTFILTGILTLFLLLLSSARAVLAVDAVYDGTRPNYVCVHTGKSAGLECPIMDRKTVWKRLVAVHGADGRVLGFDSRSLPVDRVIMPQAPGQRMDVIRTTESDEGLYGGVNSKTNQPVKCLVYLGIEEDCSKKGHLQLTVTKSSESVRPGSTLQLTSSVFLNGIPGSDMSPSFRYYDDDKDELIEDEDGVVSGARTSRLRLTGFLCTSPTNILVIASTSTTSAHLKIHVPLQGYQYLKPRLPSVVQKTVGERVELVMRMLVCSQPQIRWKLGTTDLAFFPVDKLSNNRTLVDRQDLITFKYDPFNGVLTTAVVLFAARQVDSGIYSVESRVGDNTTLAATTLQISDSTRQKDDVPMHKHGDGISTSVWIGIGLAIGLSVVIIILLAWFIIRLTGSSSPTPTALPNADVTIAHDSPEGLPDQPLRVNERLQWLRECTRRHETKHLSDIALELRRMPTVVHRFLLTLGLESNDLPNLDTMSSDCYCECFNGFKVWEGKAADQTIGALTNALADVDRPNVAMTVFRDVKPE